MSMDQMRQSYTRCELHERDVQVDPLQQFQSWFDQALAEPRPEWFEVNAMTLSTCDRQGRVTSRVVLLKGIEDQKFQFFTNYRSEKAEQMADNPRVALCFFWPHLQRQVRIEGTVSPTSRLQSESYFASRPRGSQLGAIASQQSAEIADRQILEQAFAEAQSQYPDDVAVPCPTHWGGYEVTADRIEFWQGRESRIHDRLLYRRDPVTQQWSLARLSP